MAWRQQWNHQAVWCSYPSTSPPWGEVDWPLPLALIYPIQSFLRCYFCSFKFFQWMVKKFKIAAVLVDPGLKLLAVCYSHLLECRNLTWEFCRPIVEMWAVHRILLALFLGMFPSSSLMQLRLDYHVVYLLLVCFLKFVQNVKKDYECTSVSYYF